MGHKSSCSSIEFNLFGDNIQIHAIKMKYLCYILRNINNAMKTLP